MNETAESRFVGDFAQHLVAIVARSEQWPTSDVTSAFVMSVSDQWFLVTAAHALEITRNKIGQLSQRGDVRVELVDSGGLSARHFTPVPFPLDTLPSIVLGETFDVDYAAILIPPFYRRMLEANGIKALDEQVWELQPPAPDYFMLLGFPNELVTPGPGGVLPYLTCAMHKLQRRTEELPERFREKRGPWEYFDVMLSPDATSIVGMSGGPVFAIQMEPNGRQLRYWLTGVQSAWLRESKIAAVCPANLLGKFLKQLIDEADRIKAQP